MHESSLAACYSDLHQLLLYALEMLMNLFCSRHWHCVFGLCIPVGKTTLADALLASNGIISQRLAGKVNYFLPLILKFHCSSICDYLWSFSYTYDPNDMFIVANDTHVLLIVKSAAVSW